MWEYSESVALFWLCVQKRPLFDIVVVVVDALMLLLLLVKVLSSNVDIWVNGGEVSQLWAYVIAADDLKELKL